MNWRNSDNLAFFMLKHGLMYPSERGHSLLERRLYSHAIVNGLGMFSSFPYPKTPQSHKRESDIDPDIWVDPSTISLDDREESESDSL